jgi:hypothetical protein
MTTPLTVGAGVEIDRSPEQVWSVLSDLARMPEFSPELRKAFVVGTPGLGATIIGINRRKAVAWKTRESGATWVYELEPTASGTHVTGRRVLPAYTVPSKLMVPFLGGAHGHDLELNAGIAATLQKIKAAVEA